MSARLFHVVLPSNDSSFPDNQTNDFKIALSRPLSFKDDQYVCALHSITYPRTWDSLGTLSQQFIKIIIGKMEIEISIPSGSHNNITQLLELLNKRMSDGIKEFWKERQQPALEDILGRRKKRDASKNLNLPQPPKLDKQELKKEKEDFEDEYAAITGEKKIKQPTPTLLADTNETKNEKTAPASKPGIKETPKNTKGAEPNQQVKKEDVKEPAITPSPPQPKQTAQNSAPSLQPAVTMPTAPAPSRSQSQSVASPAPHSASSPSPVIVSAVPTSPRPRPLPTTAPGPNPRKGNKGRKHRNDDDNDANDDGQTKSSAKAKKQKLDPVLKQSKEEEEDYEEEDSETDEIEAEKRNWVTSKLLEPNDVFFVLDKTTQKVVFKNPAQNIHRIGLSKQLSFVLGWPDDDNIRNGDSARYKPDISGGLRSLAVYIDGLIDNVRVGSSEVGLLRMVTVSGEHDSTVETTFENPLWCKVKCSEIDVLHCHIRTLDGDLVKFGAGVLLLTLLFKPAFGF